MKYSHSNDISEYYDTTFVHYRKWWKLNRNLSLHYGIWEDGITSFSESLVNTNRVLMELAKISESDLVLDAGCGVGGSAFFINSHKNASVTGISLSQKQVDFANAMSRELNQTEKVSFQVMDFLNTEFENGSFDIVWACESVCHAENKRAFINESFRILKKGGRLIISDFFLTSRDQKDPNNWVSKWSKLWGVPNLVTAESFERWLSDKGFTKLQNHDYTDKIIKSAKRMYYMALIGMIPSEVYNFFHPKVSRFAKKHYQSGYYQYKALKKHLWRYKIIKAVK